MFKMLIGISFITIFCDLILSQGSFKKYVRGIVGIFAFLVILEGIFSSKLYTIDTAFLDEAYEISDMTTKKAQNEIVSVYENNIKKELENNNIEVIKVEVKCDDSLTIESVNIALKDVNKINDAIKVISEKFAIEKSLIVLKGG